jgi:glycerol-3-phosphate O-acyltransferase/dihydroxyacetone phosphate acyltransferase
LLFIWGLLAFPGAILNLPVAVVAKIFSAKKAREALRGSTVKIAGRDVLATWKILVGFVLLPTIYGLYTLLLFITLLHTDLSLKWKFIAPAVVWVLLPFISYASLRFGEIGMDVYKLVFVYL